MKNKLINRNFENTEFFVECTKNENTLIKKIYSSDIINGIKNGDIYYILNKNDEIIINEITNNIIDLINELPLFEKYKVKFIVDIDSLNEKETKAYHEINDCLYLIKHKYKNHVYYTLRLVDVNINDINIVNFIHNGFTKMKIYYVDTNEIVEYTNAIFFYYISDSPDSIMLNQTIHTDFLNTKTFKFDRFKTYDYITVHNLPEIKSGWC